MKHIKTFENHIDRPEVGDYVICEVTDDYTDEQFKIDDFLNNNIGILVKIRTNEYDVQFEKSMEYSDWNDLSRSFQDNLEEGYENIASFYVDEIIFWSKDKEDLLDKLREKKYNL